MMHPLAPGTLALLRERLGDAEGAVAFARSVTAQVAHPPGHPGERPEREVAERVVELVLESRGAVGPDPAARLCADPHLLAAFFQNVDLLYQGGDPHADAVSALIMSALELAGEAEGTADTEAA